MVSPSCQYIFIIIISIAFSSAVDTFPKIMWVYWQQGYQGASAFTQLCIQNKQHLAEANHWQFSLLSKYNLQEYLDIQEMASINAIMAAADIKVVQLKADLIRMMLLYKYGGMWMDANTFFVRDLAWVDNPSKQKYIYNKIGNYPEVILGAYSVSSHGGNKTSLFDTEYNITVNLFPGLENWFILSKPKSKFLQDSLSTLKHIIAIGQKQATRQYQDQNISFPIEYMNPYFVASDYLFQVILQTKQKQINKETNYTGNPKFAVQYYKLWNFEADETTFKLSLFYSWKNNPIFFDQVANSLQQYCPEESQYPYFIKIISWQHPYFNYFMENYIEFNCWGYPFHIEEKSIWNKWLMEKSKGVEVVERIKKWNQEVNEGKATCKSQQEDSKPKWIIQIYSLSVFGVYFLIFCCFFRNCSKQTPEPDQKTKIPQELDSQMEGQNMMQQ